MTELANLESGQSAEGVLALAQRIYNEHVEEGKNTHDRLINEAEEASHKILSDAEATASRLLEEAEKVHAEKTKQAQTEADNLIKDSAAQLEAQKTQIALLQAFEAQYRKDLQKLVDDATSILKVEDSEDEKTMEESDVKGEVDSESMEVDSDDSDKPSDAYDLDEVKETK